MTAFLFLDKELIELVLKNVSDQELRRMCIVNTYLWNLIHESRDLKQRLEGRWICNQCHHVNNFIHKTCCMEDEYCVWCSGW